MSVIVLSVSMESEGRCMPGGMQAMIDAWIVTFLLLFVFLVLLRFIVWIDER